MCASQHPFSCAFLAIAQTLLHASLLLDANLSTKNNFTWLICSASEWRFQPIAPPLSLAAVYVDHAAQKSCRCHHRHVEPTEVLRWGGEKFIASHCLTFSTWANRTLLENFWSTEVTSSSENLVWPTTLPSSSDPTHDMRSNEFQMRRPREWVI